MNFEIERKFLVKGDFKSMVYSKSRIAQGYIAKKPTVRIRIRDEKGYITIKGPKSPSGMSALEWEKEITLEEAKGLMTLCLPGVIDKTRYLIKYGEHLFEVDEFYGENEGLILAEVELSSEDENFERPPFLGEEVTGDYHYYNSYLSHSPFTKWNENELK